MTFKNNLSDYLGSHGVYETRDCRRFEDRYELAKALTLVGAAFASLAFGVEYRYTARLFAAYAAAFTMAAEQGDPADPEYARKVLETLPTFIDSQTMNVNVIIQDGD